MAANGSVKKSRFGLLTGLVSAVILIPLVGGGIFLATFNPDQYRAEIAGFLSEKLGRKVSLNGTMRLKLAGGPALEVNDIVLANPAWASRPEMVKVGQMALAVKLGPLLQSPRRLEVERVTLSDTDIQLETSASGQKNWEFASAKASPEAPEKAAAQDKIAPTAAQPAPAKMPLAISLDQLLVKNLHFSMREAGKPKATELSIKELSLQAHDKTVLAATGIFNQQPFSVNLNGGSWLALLDKQPWTFAAQAKYLGNDFSGDGKVLELGKELDIPDFKLVSSLGSTVTGHLLMKLAGKPSVMGAIAIDAITLPEGNATTVAAAPGEEPVTTAAAPEKAVATKRLFSDKKFDLAPLKSVDAKLDVSIGKIAQGKLALEDIKARVDLQNGVLSLPQLTAQLAGNPLMAQMHVNATPPQQMDFGLNARDMNLQPVLQALGHSNISLGKTTLIIESRTAGDSPRLLADNLDGLVVLKIGGSILPAETMGPVVTNMLKLLSPGSPLATENKVTCGTMRFRAQDGLLTSNGILLDTSLATVLGEGTINLRQENLQLTFQPKTKDAKLAALASPMYVSGPLTKPGFKMDSVGAIASLASTFLGKELPVPSAKPVLRVPSVNPAQADPCTDALDHPTYTADAASSSAAGVSLDAGKELVQGKVKGLSEKLGKAVGGEKAPPVLKNLLGGEKSPLKGLFGQ
ncbi:MAG: AsmA family protein [Alphaproteobacteria bacterium]|nr:AsmA family protein [Alphaproteobacteria bacterium]